MLFGLDNLKPFPEQPARCHKIKFEVTHQTTLLTTTTTRIATTALYKRQIHQTEPNHPLISDLEYHFKPPIKMFKSITLTALLIRSTDAAGCYPTWTSGSAYSTGSLVSATRIVNATAGTSVKKNFECTSGSQPALSHCPNYDPSNAIQAAAAWKDLGECTGTAAAPTPSNKPTYAKWTGSGCPATWVDGFAYEGGDLAEVNGNVYKCSTTPFVNAWCGNPSYKPGDSTYWQQAWTLLGSCTGTMSPSKAPSFKTIKSAGGCPEPYAASTTYEAGDKVEANGLAYQCRSWPNSAWCSMNGYEPDGPNSKDAWTLLGYCAGSIAPTSSPNFSKLSPAGGCPDAFSDAASYEAGDKVTLQINSATSLVYECQSFPNSGYCDQYEPGHWSKLGWSLKGYCNGTIAPTQSPSFVKLADNNGCPKAYSASATYEANDKVSTDLDGTNSLVWKCSSDIHLSRYCSQFEPGNPAKLGWTLVARCDGTIAPSKAPTFAKLVNVTNGCPRVYSKTTKYEEGDLVSVLVSTDPAVQLSMSARDGPRVPTAMQVKTSLLNLPMLPWDGL
ncbi:hypothetical protein HJC23_008778 [Cyclotella cryptica]|uniref:Chitin-binding type-3 domain-containing protein n=1 Tax=Cyclotella cryptica TaxID=29204 RepID=A0ABD3PRJ4_9STRA